jgi:hypothetical protein
VLSSFFVGIKNPDNSTHYKQFLKEVKCDFPLRPEGRGFQVDIKGVLADEKIFQNPPQLRKGESPHKDLLEIKVVKIIKSFSF